MEARAGTQAPAEVRGLSEPAKAGDPVAAAKAHLADPRYHLNPADLAPLRTVKDGQDETVRFAQRYRGLPVFGAHYLVHFRTEGGQREVVGAGGRFLTELSVDPAPAVKKESAAKIARSLMARPYGAPEGLAARTGELVVVPRGAGVLAWHVVLSGKDRTARRPVLLDAYVDAHSGRPLFAVDRLRFEGPVQGSGQTAHGQTVPLNAYQRADGAYELRDRTRPMWNGTTGEILTYDAKGGEVFDYLEPGIPPGTELARSATPVFGPSTPRPAPWTPTGAPARSTSTTGGSAATGSTARAAPCTPSSTSPSTASRSPTPSGTAPRWSTAAAAPSTTPSPPASTWSATR
ncbi:putative neutral zinc metalloprotease [[Actinomadura] parvosata subsp. kistnae]|nr:putative neutral zinc metalloprotease [Actinomadura parvosata subsp. kistnae]